jgi:hypothetical protein
VALISESLQVASVSGAIWLFYGLLGSLLVSARGAWLLQPSTVIWDVAWFGERVQVTAALLRVATGVAGFAGLYYAVTILVDSAYRDQFVDTLSEQLRETFERRSEYLDVLRRRGVAVAPASAISSGVNTLVARAYTRSGLVRSARTSNMLDRSTAWRHGEGRTSRAETSTGCRCPSRTSRLAPSGAGKPGCQWRNSVWLVRDQSGAAQVDHPACRSVSGAQPPLTSRSRARRDEAQLPVRHPQRELDELGRRRRVEVRLAIT